MRNSTLIFMLAACLQGGAHAAPAKKMIFVGDSITEGYGVSHDQAYPALIQKKILAAGKNWMVVNSGISGSTSASAPSRVRWILKEKPDLVLIALGANDGLRGLPVKEMASNLTQAVTLCKEAHVKVILIGMKLPPNYGEKYTQDFSAVFPDVAQKLSVPLIPFLLDKVGGIKDLNQADGIHPNEKGHVIIADTVYRDIAKFL